MGKKHAEKYARPLAVGHMIYLLMWLTGSCIQICRTKRQELHSFETLLIFLVCTFFCFIFLLRFCSFICAVFALRLVTEYAELKELCSVEQNNLQL